MIIARLQGGLGNQLFQYAAARALSARLGKSFKLETITALQKDKLRDVALQATLAHFEMATTKEVKEFVFFPSLYRHRPNFFSKLGKHIYREPHFQFDKNFLHLTDPIFLDGFFQSPRYFEDISTIIRQEFRIREELTMRVSKKAAELEELPSVAVHIRRGDFLNPKTAAYHGVLDATYYAKAVEFIQEKIPGAFFYIFSDDIEWVKDNIPLPTGTEFVSSFTKSPIEDFFLMTKCRHNIIANSSFSWWPAWLNNNQGKMVIAPKRWFANPNMNTSDLIPGEWTRL